MYQALPWFLTETQTPCPQGAQRQVLWGSITPREILTVTILLRVEAYQRSRRGTSREQHGDVKVPAREQSLQKSSATEESEMKRGALSRSGVEFYQPPLNSFMLPFPPFQSQLSPSFQLLDLYSNHHSLEFVFIIQVCIPAH